MIVFTRVYPLLEILRLVPEWGRYQHLLRVVNDRTSPVGSDPISDVNHLVATSYVASSFCGSVTGIEGRVYESF